MGKSLSKKQGDTMKAMMMLGALLALPFVGMADQAPVNPKAKRAEQVKAMLSKINPVYQGAPTSASEKHLEGIPPITKSKVKGSYVVKSFTNSEFFYECGDPSVGQPDEPLSIATIYKLILRNNGTGKIPYLATTISFSEGYAETFIYHDIPVKYSFDPFVNGVGHFILKDFPFEGTHTKLHVIFKVREDKVVGFDSLSENGEENDYFYLWFLGEGFKNSDSSSCDD